MIQSGCTQVSSTVSYYNQAEFFKGFYIRLDWHYGAGQYYLQMYEFDGTPKPWMWQTYNPPQMLPTTPLKQVVSVFCSYPDLFLRLNIYFLSRCMVRSTTQDQRHQKLRKMEIYPLYRMDPFLFSSHSFCLFSTRFSCPACLFFALPTFAPSTQTFSISESSTKKTVLCYIFFFQS